MVPKTDYTYNNIPICHVVSDSLVLFHLKIHIVYIIYIYFEYFYNKLSNISYTANHIDIFNLMFQAIYRAIDEYQVGPDASNILSKLENYLSEAPQSNCGNLKDALLKYVKPKR